MGFVCGILRVSLRQFEGGKKEKERTLSRSISKSLHTAHTAELYERKGTSISNGMIRYEEPGEGKRDEPG